MALITSRDAAFAYDHGIVVEGLNFSVDAGDYLCIAGENGSGKSTLLKGMLGLKTPVKGEIVFGDGLKAKEVGYLPQQTPAQMDFPASVFEVALSGCLNALGKRPFYTNKERDRTRENLERLGVLELKDRCYRELSGGQQQRVLLARALSATSRLLLMDEPAAGLDPLVTAELYALIDDINRKSGITVVMVSHDIASAAKHASHVLHLHANTAKEGGVEQRARVNRQAFFGGVEEYLASPAGRSFVEGDSNV